MIDANCVTCKKPIGAAPFHKHEFVISGQGTRRNFRAYFKYWHEACWLEEERAEAERRRANDAEFQRELAEAKKGL